MALIDDLQELPEAPGVYIIKNANGIAIYVGKAKNLKNRVKAHFVPTLETKELQIQTHAASVEWILTRDENESILLERKLIKDLKPKYNVKLKDDKSGLLIRITLSEKYPRLLMQRETDPKNEKDVYIGPFPLDSLLRKTVKIALKLFPICNYKKPLNKTKLTQIKHHCIRYRLKRCLAPCETQIESTEYLKTVKKLIMFLEGQVGDLIKNLEEEMWEAAQHHKYERAAELRDQIKTIQELVNVHSSLNIDVEDMDVVDFVVSEGILVLGLVQVRNKRIKKISTEILNEFAFKSWNDIIMYLFKMKKNARKVLVTEEFFHYISSPPPSNIIRKSLEAHEMLLNIAKRNAKAALQSYLRTTKATVDYEKTLEQMQEILKLPKIPHIINGFDISTLKGLNSTGSCVVFIDGVPVKKFYRKFRIRQKFDEPNDYAMMKELISRRFKSIKLEEDPYPDLIIVDGGKGQLSIAEQVLNELKLKIPVVSIAKQNEEIYIQNEKEPIVLEEQSQVLRLIQHVRDEAHRFAITYHKQLRKRTMRPT
ncbi:MAG: excinuclease ABC subunit UvrC [Candidatus Heimdallarchaeaceae archaeon]